MTWRTYSVPFTVQLGTTNGGVGLCDIATNSCPISIEKIHLGACQRTLGTFNLSLKVATGGYTVGSGGSGGSIAPYGSSFDAPAVETATLNNTTKLSAGAGTITTVDALSWETASPLTWYPSKDLRVNVPIGGYFSLSLDTTPNNQLVSGVVVFREMAYTSPAQASIPVPQAISGKVWNLYQNFTFGTQTPTSGTQVNTYSALTSAGWGNFQKFANWYDLTTFGVTDGSGPAYSQCFQFFNDHMDCLGIYTGGTPVQGGGQIISARMEYPLINHAIGYFEAQVKIPTSSAFGAWPSWSIIGQSETSNTISSSKWGPEVDVFEFFTDLGTHSANDTSHNLIGLHSGVSGQSNPTPNILITQSPYNAVGDGVTDNTTAINNALSFAASNPGTAVIVPAGTFVYSGILNVAAGVTFSGDLTQSSPDNCVLMFASAGNPANSCISVNGNNATIQWMKLACQASSARQSTNTSMRIYGNYVSGLTVQNVHIVANAFGSGGIGLWGCSNANIHNNTIENTNADSIHQTDGCNTNQIKNNRIMASGDDSISIVSYGTNANPCQNIIVDSNTILNQKYGRAMSLVGGNNWTCSNNHVDYNDTTISYPVSTGSQVYAQIYVASETSYSTYPVGGTNYVYGNTIKNNNSTNHSPIVMYPANGTISGMNFGVDSTNTAHPNQCYNPGLGASSGNVIIQITPGLAWTGGIQHTYAYTVSGFSMFNTGSNATISPNSDNTLNTLASYPGDLVVSGGGISTGTVAYDFLSAGGAPSNTYLASGASYSLTPGSNLGAVVYYTATDFSSAYHRYGVLIDTNYNISIWIDDIKVCTFAANQYCTDAGSPVFVRPVLDLAIGSGITTSTASGASYAYGSYAADVNQITSTMGTNNTTLTNPYRMSVQWMRFWGP